MKLAKFALIAAASLALSTPAAQAAGDAARGAKVFKKCKACHRIGPNAKNAFGPELNGVIGRAAGSVAGYRYSKDLAAAGAAGLVWNQELVAEWITNPSKFLKTYLKKSNARSKMSFKDRKAADREDVTAYLATFPAN